MSQMKIPTPDTVLRGHTDAVNSVCFLSEFLLASGTGDGELKIWDLNSRRAKFSQIVHRSSILSVARICQNPSQILTAGRDGLLKLWCVGVWQKPILSLECGAQHFCGTVTDCRHIDMNTVVSPSRNESEALVWDLRAPLAPVGIVEEGPVVGANGLKCGILTSLLYSSSSPFGAGTPDVASAAFHADTGISSSSGTLFAGYESGLVRCIDVRTWRELARCRPHVEPVLAMDIVTTTPRTPPACHLTEGSRAGRDETATRTTAALMTGGADNRLHLNRLRRVPVCAKGEGEENPAPPLDTAPSPSPFPSSPPEVSMAPAHSASFPIPGIGAVRGRSDGRLLASAHWDGTVRLFDSRRLQPLVVLRHHKESVYALDFGLPDTSTAGWFASGSKDCTVAVWSLYADR